MNVEFIGLPGAGKTTFRRALLDVLHSQANQRYLSVEDAFLQIARRHIDGLYRLPLRILPAAPARALSSRLINRNLMQFEAQNRFLAHYGDSLAAFLASPAFAAMTTDNRSLMIESFLETAALLECVAHYLPKKQVVLFEEGLLQKSFMFVDHQTDTGIDPACVYRYLESIPLPDLVIYVQAGRDTCYQRMIDRPDGLTRRLRSATEQQIDHFLQQLEVHLNMVVKWFSKQMNDRLIAIDSECDLHAQLAQVSTQLEQLR